VGVLLKSLLALCCFAGNSLLCRSALRSGLIDASTFGAIRMAAGAGALTILVQLAAPARKLEARRGVKAFAGPFWLSLYMACFSFSYLRLDAGVGALILFGVVQATMIGVGALDERGPSAREWRGLGIALVGLGLLTVPGRAAPDSRGAFLMALAGVGWGMYSLAGRKVRSPLLETRRNFVWSMPAMLGVAGAWLLSGSISARVTGEGVLLAAISGALTSGVGYAIWYSVLPSLGATRAAIFQLSVPVLAVAGGFFFLDESPSPRALISGAVILFGVGHAVAAKFKR
jgi:drug/metabolite transporter (DMT)-like permease